MVIDDENCRKPVDLGRINIDEAPELLYWCKHFKCTEADVRAAVTAVGVMAWDVGAFIQSKAQPERDDCLRSRSF